jgi:hypothetical protein
MDVKIDYISFSWEFPEHLKNRPKDERITADALVEHVFSGNVISLVISDNWQVYKGGKFYEFRIMDSNSKISLAFSYNKPHFTVELSGQTCELIRLGSAETEVLHLCEKRITRIDLAVDFDTDVAPSDFLSNGYNTTFKGRSSIVEVTGETQYVGSWNSERFARVYRYHEPHPRSRFLRVEHVFRGEWAKSYVSAILQHGLAHAVASAGRAFEWQSPLWQPAETTIGKITAPRTTPSQSAKYRWLVTQVAPAIRKAIEDGWFDLPQWLNEHIYNQ